MFSTNRRSSRTVRTQERRKWWSAGTAALVLLAGCRGGGQPHRLVLDGRARIPDAEGVVEKITFGEVTLDGGRTYGVRKDLQSFSTYDLAAVPMLHRLGQYVQLGLDGKKVAWMAGIGVVVRGDAPPVVFYNGVLARRGGDERVIFRDGTVLRLGDGVPGRPLRTGPLRAEIDPATHTVRALVTS